MLTKREARRLAAKGADPAPGDFAPPAEPIRLGDIGYFRDQRFVEVIYTPVVSPTGGGEALFFGKLDVDLVVDGVDSQSIADLPAPTDPLFEDQYRLTFANYDESRYFRAGRAARAASAPGVAPSGRTSGRAIESSLSATSGAHIASNFPSYKLTVTKDGIYRMSGTYLTAAGTGVAQGLTGADPRQFKIMNRGVEIPIFVSGEGDGSFDSGDFVEFFGQRLDGPETILNFSLGQSPGIYQSDDYGDKNVYWLSVDMNGTRLRMSARSAPPNAGLPLATDFGETIHTEVDNLYQPTGGDDPFLEAPRLNSNPGAVAADAN
ncbi:MAG TPA: hypothetical protein VE404_01995, partial [Verrucomicrobiae bacterium]|nr:hypothetical protein [Verrucomicrobiae bacterium]